VAEGWGLASSLIADTWLLVPERCLEGNAALGALTAGRQFLAAPLALLLAIAQEPPFGGGELEAAWVLPSLLSTQADASTSTRMH
jgi:hypothetical protein